MRSNIISTIYRKELREVLRDKRMIYLVILLPFFLYPVLFTLMGKVGASQRDKISSEKVTVLLSPAAEQTPVYSLLQQDTTLVLKLQEFNRETIDTQKNTIGLIVPPDLSDRLGSGQSATLTLMGNETKEVIGQRMRQVRGQLQGLGQQIAMQRLTEANLSPEIIQPLAIREESLASEQNRFGEAIGGFLPLMILLFVFMGCIYIAIDITAGEKERRTLQTLFTTPVTTSEIISGKFLAVVTVGLASAAANLLSLMGSMYLMIYLIGDGSESMAISVPPMAWLWFIILVLLSTVFIAAITLAVVLLANSYKEAQSYVSPLMMVVLIPAVLAQMPGMELNMSTALVPMFNIVLAMSDIFSGDYSLPLVGMVAGFALLYGMAGLWLASRTFGNENVVTGEKVDWKSLLRGN